METRHALMGVVVTILNSAYACIMKHAPNALLAIAAQSLLFLGVGPNLAAQEVRGQQFEVATIKPDHGAGDGTTINVLPGGRFVATNVNLRTLVMSAFGVRDFQVTGGPGWVDGEAYDVSAKAPEGTHVDDAELKPLLQALLVERFKLKVHHEVRQLPVYSLIVVKKGPKLAPHTGPNGPSGRTLFSSGKATMSATAAPISALADNLGRAVGRTVQDNTGLQGLYDFTVEWVPDQTAASEGASIFTALQEQLGLKLEATHGPVEVIVIDSVEKAALSDN